MSGGVYYNEIDPFAAEWLRRLMDRGFIARGDVDERSIAEVRADDVRGYDQCHFFAGIGTWSLALRRARWRDDRPVWTGSCPCQPFSQAGRRGGAKDERHLWPVWARLIAECRPSVVFGEQVASPDGLAWLDLVSADLEGADYAFGAADLCAAGVGAPHIRQRLYFVADAGDDGRRSWGLGGAADARNGDAFDRRGSARDGLADADEGGRRSDDGNVRAGKSDARRRRGLGDAGGPRGGRDARGVPRTEEGGGQVRETPRRFPDLPLASGRGLGLPDGKRLDGASVYVRPRKPRPEVVDVAGAGPVSGVWADAEWIPCLDGKSRPAQPGAFPLAHGVPGRVGLLRAYGNSIVVDVASTFVEAFMEAR